MDVGRTGGNATWRNAYLSPAQELRDGLPLPKNARALRDVVKGMDPLSMLNALSVRLDGPAAAGLRTTIEWKLSDSDDRYYTSLQHGVLHHERSSTVEPTVVVSLDGALLNDVAIGHIGLEALPDLGTTIQGDEAVLRAIFDLLDEFPAWFPLASHGTKHGDDVVGSSRGRA